MTLRNNSFVAHAEYISGIKSPGLKDLLKIGSCMKTPLEKKATFSYTWTRINGQDMVTQVTFYAPGSDLPSQVFNLLESNYITLQNWYRMMRPVWEYPEFIEEYNELERVRDIVKRFEEAAKHHGATQRSVADGNIGEHHAYETGKLLKTLRAELYEELGV
ncbi:conserved hypothetical protein [Edwardsiella phage PEi26]|uniref:Uncharacterized protein n=1 Tax=Edwardsiella phage PEi26 TaxID=1608311 RepID=A0A0B6VTX3_9CAUD|nr:conserved hypothetical protein [Edwardsiella phage PEi26]